MVYQDASVSSWSSPPWDGLPGLIEVSQTIADTSSVKIVALRVEGYMNGFALRLLSLWELKPSLEPELDADDNLSAEKFFQSDAWRLSGVPPSEDLRATIIEDGQELVAVPNYGPQSSGAFILHNLGMRFTPATGSPDAIGYFQHHTLWRTPAPRCDHISIIVEWPSVATSGRLDIDGGSVYAARERSRFA